MLQRGDESDNRDANHVVLLLPTAYHNVSTSDENWSWVGVSINKKQPCVGCSTQPAWLSQVDGTACEVQADTQAHHATSVARRTTHKPQPRPRWSRSGCLRGRRNGLLSHEGILALQRGEDVKTDTAYTLSCFVRRRAVYAYLDGRTGHAFGVGQLLSGIGSDSTARHGGREERRSGAGRTAVANSSNSVSERNGVRGVRGPTHV